MIARDPQQRGLYNQRLKMQMYEKARLQAAMAEGEARGEGKGQIIGRIRLLQQLNEETETAAELLTERTLESLSALESEL